MNNYGKDLTLQQVKDSGVWCEVDGAGDEFQYAYRYLASIDEWERKEIHYKQADKDLRTIAEIPFSLALRTDWRMCERRVGERRIKDEPVGTYPYRTKVKDRRKVEEKSVGHPVYPYLLATDGEAVKRIDKGRTHPTWSIVDQTNRKYYDGNGDLLPKYYCKPRLPFGELVRDPQPISDAMRGDPNSGTESATHRKLTKPQPEPSYVVIISRDGRARRLMVPEVNSKTVRERLPSGWRMAMALWNRSGVGYTSIEDDPDYQSLPVYDPDEGKVFIYFDGERQQRAYSIDMSKYIRKDKIQEIIEQELIHLPGSIDHFYRDIGKRVANMMTCPDPMDATVDEIDKIEAVTDEPKIDPADYRCAYHKDPN